MSAGGSFLAAHSLSVPDALSEVNHNRFSAFRQLRAQRIDVHPELPYNDAR